MYRMWALGMLGDTMSEVITQSATEKEDRKLATVRVVSSLEPIKGADFLELATIDGWRCVVSKKDNLKVGDKVVYFEIDSVLPSNNPLFEFMAPRNYKVKTIKLRGEVSQGLAMPLASFPQVGDEDTDVTELLGVTKVKPKDMPKQLAGFAKGNFPSFIPKTDEERLQNVYGKLLDYFDDRKWVATEKLDGSSMTVYLNNDVFGVCSRNLDLKLDESNAGNAFVSRALGDKLEEKMRLASTCDSVPDNFAIQGELVGPGIQGNKYNLSETRYYAFNVYDIDNMRYLDYHDFVAVCRMMGVLTVDEVLFNVTLSGIDMKEFVRISTQKSLLNSKIWLEGLVFRPINEVYVHRFGRLSFKVINPQFLLANDE